MPLIEPAEVVARARSQIGMRTVYDLGRGGYYPGSLTAADSKGRCDCSGFVAWSLKESRHVDLSIYVEQLGHWIETSAIVRDAMRPFGMFDRVPVSLAQPGMVLVYGDQGGHQGHVGVISEVALGAVSKVVHCSKGNYTATGDAIQETGPQVFLANPATIVARFANVHHPGFEEAVHA